MTTHDLDCRHMRRALELAKLGEGYVEPNPMVGSVLAVGDRILAEGWHAKYGGDHAEVAALNNLSDAEREEVASATLYVTLEPCCHQGKTPACTDAILGSGIRRVVVAHRDPFPQVNGGGIRRLEQAGVTVTVGTLQSEAEELLRPYLHRVQLGRPWIVAKWAMTLDGKIATASGDSQWISNEASRAVVHRLRGRMDGIMVGGGTLRTDDPRLTARPPGPRVATRIVWCRANDLLPNSCLVASLDAAPIMIAGPESAISAMNRLEGVKYVQGQGQTFVEQLNDVLRQLAEFEMTNILVEGGGVLLGALRDGGLIDEVHVFVAPRLAGGAGAASPIGGMGVSTIAESMQLANVTVEQLGGDVYVRGRVQRS